MDDNENTEAAWRAAQIDAVREERGEPVSQARQLQIRASAIALGRERLGLTGAARAASLQNERRVLAAAERAYNGEPVELAFAAERCERDGSGGMATVTTLMPDAQPKATPVLTGYASRYDTWAEILNPQEGHFKERVAPSAFTRSLASNDKILSLYMHGRDPLLAQRPLGRLTLNSDPHGLFYSVETIPHRSVSYIVEACRMGLLDSSFSFEPRVDTWRQPTRSTDYNPTLLPERTLQDVKLREVGPCPLAAYGGTEVGVRDARGEEDAERSRLTLPTRTKAERAAVLRRLELQVLDAQRR